MLIDYLRYVAFKGHLRGFFEKGLYNYVKQDETTGQHLRFSPEFIDERLGLRGQEVIHDLYCMPLSKDLIFERMKSRIGISGGPDGIRRSPFRVGGEPSCFTYNDGENSSPKLEIIVDIDPKHWNEGFSETTNYEGTPIIFRQAGVARANINSGDKLFDSKLGTKKYGTLCGIFSTSKSEYWGLTCEHVVRNWSHVSIEHIYKVGKFRSKKNRSILGDVCYKEVCGEFRDFEQVRTQLDAVLIALEPSYIIESEMHKDEHRATVKPISEILQEEPILFRGAGRIRETLARVSAVTVRKSIDLYNDGKLKSVGDVLMLGHERPMYIAQPISRGGDSGAAVRQSFSSVGGYREHNQWFGMVLGSDGEGAYATHAENLFAWAQQVLVNPDIEFLYEV